MNKIKSIKNIALVIIIFILLWGFSNTVYASMGLDQIGWATYMKWSEGREIITSQDLAEMTYNPMYVAMLEECYLKEYFSKEIKAFDNIDEYDHYEKAVAAFFASKGNSLETLEIEAGWKDAYLQRWAKSSEFMTAEDSSKLYSDARADRAKNDKARKNASNASTTAGIIENITVYNGIDYSAEFNAQYYYDAYPDLQQAIGKDGEKLLMHYINYGKAEGRKAIK